MQALTITAHILDRIAEGDSTATNDLVKHIYPMLLKWAHGRIPANQRNLVETSDLVQEALSKGIQRVDNFQSFKAGAFLAYLRKIFIHCLYQNTRDTQAKQRLDSLQDKQESTFELDMAEFILYENALKKMSNKEQEAIILRIEFGMTYKEVALAMGKKTEDAARMFTNRALLKMANHLKE